MKKIILFITLILIFISCDKTDKNNGLIISSVKILENKTLHKANLNAYNIQISLKNESPEIIHFWSFVNGWYSNFIFDTNQEISFYQSFKSDAPRVFTLAPSEEHSFVGIVLSPIKISKINIDIISIGFKYYNVKQFSKYEYMNSDLKFIGDDTFDSKQHPDTIWYSKKITFVGKIK